VHHAGHLNRRRVTPGVRGRHPHGRRGRAGLGRRHQVEYHAVRDPPGQRQHPRPERGKVYGQVGAHDRAVERHHAGAEHLARVSARRPGQHRADGADILFDHFQRSERGNPEPPVHDRVGGTQPGHHGAGFDSLADLGHFDEDGYALRRRVQRLATDHAWTEDPPWRTRHLVGNVRTFAAGGARPWVSCAPRTWRLWRVRDRAGQRVHAGRGGACPHPRRHAAADLGPGFRPEISLCPLELEALTWQDHELFSKLLATPRGPEDGPEDGVRDGPRDAGPRGAEGGP